MSTLSQHPPDTPVSLRALASAPREMWAAVSICAMWLAVLFDALFGPDIVTTNASAQTTTVPSAVVVAFFAMLATVAVVRRAFGPRA